MKQLLMALCSIILMVSCNKAEPGTYAPPHAPNTPATYFTLSYKGEIYTLYDVVSGTSHSLKGTIVSYKIDDTTAETTLKVSVKPANSDPFTVEMTGASRRRFIGDVADIVPNLIYNNPSFSLTFKGQTTVHSSSTFPTNSLEVSDVYGSGDEKYARGAFRFRVDGPDDVATGSFRVFYDDK